MGFNKFHMLCRMLARLKLTQRGGCGGRSPTNLQTQCSYDGFQQDSTLKHALHGLGLVSGLGFRVQGSGLRVQGLGV